MKFRRRQFLQLAAGASALPAVSHFAWAQDYPTRPIHLIVGFTPGAAADVTARILGESMGPLLGQQIAVENKPGGGSSIAADMSPTPPRMATRCSCNLVHHRQSDHQSQSGLSI